MPTYQELKAQADNIWQAVVKPTRPQVFIATETNSRGALADRTADAIRAELKRRNIQADVYETGTTGLAYAEPTVDIIKPGGPRVRYGAITPDKVSQLVEEVIVKNGSGKAFALGIVGAGAVDGIASLDDLPQWNLQNRVAMRNCGVIDPRNVFHYIANGGFSGLAKALGMKPADAVEEVVKSNLRGRGGAAFVTGQKWKFLAGSPGPVKYILCNAEEGDPGAFNDKGLLESDPFTVLEGITIAGYGTAASKGFVFIRCVHLEVIARVEDAIKQLYDNNLLGKNILGSTFSFDIEVAQTGESYVAGEETALMEAIEGKRAMPRSRPPFPAQVGLWGKPSNINNVKTYAYVPVILEKGGDWYASIGTEKSKGTALICLSGHIARPGVYEVPFGKTIREVLEVCGGGVTGSRIKLLQTGGPLGGVLGGNELDVKLDFDEMAAKGAILGSGGVIVANEQVCAVDMIRVLAEFNQEESCGKCFPCRVGTRHVWEILERIAEGHGKPGDVEKMLAIGNTMVASLCGHGQLGGNPIRSAVRYFKDEIDAHIKDKRCATGACKGLAATQPAPAGARA